MLIIRKRKGTQNSKSRRLRWEKFHRQKYLVHPLIASHTHTHTHRKENTCSTAQLHTPTCIYQKKAHSTFFSFIVYAHTCRHMAHLYKFIKHTYTERRGIQHTTHMHRHPYEYMERGRHLHNPSYCIGHLHTNTGKFSVVIDLWIS